MDLGRNTDNSEKTKRFRRESIPDEFRQSRQMPGSVVVHKKDFILIGKRLRNAIKTKCGSLVEIETVVIISTVGNDGKHLGISPQWIDFSKFQIDVHPNDLTGRFANGCVGRSVFGASCLVIASPKQILKVVPACFAQYWKQQRSKRQMFVEDQRQRADAPPQSPPQTAP